MSTEVKEVPVEAHNSIGKVERYYAPLRRLYEILQDKLKGENLEKELILQMAVKAVNDSVGPEGLVPTLLVFGAYPRMTMKEVRRLYAERQVRDALAMRNGPSTSEVLSLPLQSDVQVWREKDG